MSDHAGIMDTFRPVSLWTDATSNSWPCVSFSQQEPWLTGPFWYVSLSQWICVFNMAHIFSQAKWDGQNEAGNRAKIKAHDNGSKAKASTKLKHIDTKCNGGISRAVV